MKPQTTQYAYEIVFFGPSFDANMQIQASVDRFWPQEALVNKAPVPHTSHTHPIYGRHTPGAASMAFSSSSSYTYLEKKEPIESISSMQEQARKLASAFDIAAKNDKTSVDQKFQKIAREQREVLELPREAEQYFSSANGKRSRKMRKIIPKLKMLARPRPTIRKYGFPIVMQFLEERITRYIALLRMPKIEKGDANNSDDQDDQGYYLYPETVL